MVHALLAYPASFLSSFYAKEEPGKIQLAAAAPYYHPRDLSLVESASAEIKLSQELQRAEIHMKAQSSRGLFARSFAHLSRSEIPYFIETVKETPYIGVAHAQGRRLSMEDFHITHRGFFEKEPFELYAVIDGHGGQSCGAYLKEHLAEAIEKAIEKHGTCPSGVRIALKEAFVQLDAEMAENIGLVCGAAAVVCLKIGSELWTANLGDCPAVLKAGKKTIQLSVDAKPEDPRFKAGIEKRGGWVDRSQGIPRVNGALAVARAFGDKVLRGFDGHYVVSPRPKITRIDLSAYRNEKVQLLMACDGIWDVASSKEAASLLQNNPPEKAAEKIVRASIAAGSIDNCSALVAHL